MNLSEPKLETRDSLTCHYSTQPIEQLMASEGVLAVVSNETDCEPGGDARHYRSGLATLAGPAVHEVWSTSGVVNTGIDGDCHWSQAEDSLFVACWIDESCHANQRQAVQAAYSGLLSFIRARGYPEIVRIWNYMPHINDGEADAERYRQFCLGRQQAFTDIGYDSYPSACALGHRGDQTIIYLLAGRAPVVHIENPRQQSAYDYPRQYGPASPSFARASLVNWPASSQLFISGTASIVGHQSHHPGDLDSQLQTTFDNIDALLERCAHQTGLTNRPVLSLVKVYIRDPADYARTAERVQQHFGDTPVLYLQADICRRELMVEIDGLCNLNAPASTGGVPLRAIADE